jgi:6-pyruvoyltetrahydropterin/6-carboxytetrahydropterin synthase
MTLYINKKIEFSSSHKYSKNHLSDSENFDIFGPSSKGNYGHGHNFEAYFVFSGKVNQSTGMVVELSKIKNHLLESIMNRYDHKYLNRDIPEFSTMLPSPERLSETLLKEAHNHFSSWPITPLACHIKETHTISATAFTSKFTEKHIKFSGLIDYRPADVTLSFEGPITNDLDLIINEHQQYATLQSLIFPKSKITTFETLLNNFSQLKETFPLKRLRLEFSVFTIDLYADSIYLSCSHLLQATHRLKCTGNSEIENKTLFGKCANPHGHDFKIQITKKLNSKSNLTSITLNDFHTSLINFLDPFQYKSLEEETELFKDSLCTCEKMIYSFKSAYEKLTNSPLSQIKLKETPNNRFTLRHENTF